MVQLSHLKALMATMANSLTFEDKKPEVQGGETTYLRSYCWLIIHSIIFMPFKHSLT